VGKSQEQSIRNAGDEMSKERVIEVMKRYSLLDWPSLLIGRERGWVDRNDIIAFATDYLTRNPEENNLLIALMAGGSEYDDTRLREMLEQYVMASFPAPARDRAVDGWLLASLLEVSDNLDAYEGKQDSDEAMDRLEEIYSAFEYPEDIAGCSRYFSLADYNGVRLNIGDKVPSAPLDRLREAIQHFAAKLGIEVNR
jgi:hypothetical protein